MKKYEEVVIVIKDTADDLIKTSGGVENETTPMPLAGSIFTTNG